MANRWVVALKVLVHVACFWPIAWMSYELFTGSALLGADPIAYVTHATGFGALRILVISLAISPVRKLVPRFSWLIRFRRMLGLYAFFWATLHLLIYVGLYSAFNFQLVADDLKKRPYIWAGFTAWMLMLPLALTSTKWSIRKLGGKRWQLLHRLAYVSAMAGVVHYWWIVKTGVLSPLKITVVLAVLLAGRPLLSWREAHRKARLTARTAMP